MLAIPMALFTDLPQVQLFVMTAVLDLRLFFYNGDGWWQLNLENLKLKVNTQKKTSFHNHLGILQVNVRNPEKGRCEF